MKRRLQRHYGQSLVEFAFFFSIILILIGALIDMTTLLDDHLMVVHATQQGALAGALSGNNSLADCEILAAIYAQTQRLTNVSIARITIYQASSTGTPLGGVGSTTTANVYPGNPGCPSPASPPSPSIANWQPSVRNAALYTENSLGVEIDYSYSWQTMLINVGSISLSDASVMPIILHQP